MSVGAFIDKNQQPTDIEVHEAIGSKLSLWQELIRDIRESYPSREDFKFLYGKDYGWAVRFRINGQLLISLYPSNDGFTAQINLNPEAIEIAQRMKLGANAQQAIVRAYPYPEGRWLFISVEDTNDQQDVLHLLALRVKAKHLMKE